MWSKEKFIQELYNRQGEFLGVLISPELWESIGEELEPILKKGLKELTTREDFLEKEEPIEDWNILKKNWDFNYPVNMEVRCEICGNYTKNWQEDEPRKFILKAANVGGLVSFLCKHCKARIIKKHFKDHIHVETEEYHK